MPSGNVATNMYTSATTEALTKVQVYTFYHFFDFTQYREWQAPLRAYLRAREVKGTLLLSPEGINATLAGKQPMLDEVMAKIRSMHPCLASMQVKMSSTSSYPFQRTKVKLKKAAIPFPRACAPSEKTGTDVAATDWNKVIHREDVTLLDARNCYEIRLGTFEGAIDPNIRTFNELAEYIETHLDPAKHPHIATFCTGGIRCEKFTGWLLERGHKQVYQLEGGILKYLEEVPKEESSWQGECYVFDERIAVGHGLTPSHTATMCPACGNPLTMKDREDTSYIEGEHCGYCD